MDETRVTHSAWIREVGRPDVLDDGGDDLRCPVAEGMSAFWSPDGGVRWPRTPRGWRSFERWHAAALEPSGVR